MTPEESLRYFQALDEMKKRGFVDRNSHGLPINFIRPLDDKQQGGHRVAEVDLQWSHASSKDPCMGVEADATVPAEHLQQFWDLLGIFPAHNHPIYKEILDHAECVLRSQINDTSDSDTVLKMEMDIVSEFLGVMTKLPAPPEPGKVLDRVEQMQESARKKYTDTQKHSWKRCCEHFELLHRDLRAKWKI